MVYFKQRTRLRVRGAFVLTPRLAAHAGTTAILSSLRTSAHCNFSLTPLTLFCLALVSPSLALFERPCECSATPPYSLQPKSWFSYRLAHWILTLLLVHSYLQSSAEDYDQLPTSIHTIRDAFGLTARSNGRTEWDYWQGARRDGHNYC